LPTRSLGDLVVPAMGYGAMVLAGVYAGAAAAEVAETALESAVANGCTFVDTSDSYLGNEETIGRFLRDRDRADLIVGTKFGLRLGPDEPARELPVPWDVGAFRVNAEPARVRQYLEASLERLGTDHVDLYSPHFTDPGVPIEATVEAMAELVGEGIVRHLGLSNPSADELRRVQRVHPIAAVQVEWSMWHPADPELVERCEASGTGLVAWAPLGRGFLTGGLAKVGERDFRSRIERFNGNHLTENNARYRPIRDLAADLDVTPAQLALAWLLQQSERVVPIPGSRTPRHIAENAAAATITWAPEVRKRVDDIVGAFDPSGTIT
jgi:aryl-alcohol dehydrogenase-like predicted oxidoreductase